MWSRPCTCGVPRIYYPYNLTMTYGCIGKDSFRSGIHFTNFEYAASICSQLLSHPPPLSCHCDIEGQVIEGRPREQGSAGVADRIAPSSRRTRPESLVSNCCFKTLIWQEVAASGKARLFCRHFTSDIRLIVRHRSKRCNKCSV